MKKGIPGWVPVLALVAAVFFTAMAAARDNAAAAESPAGGTTSSVTAEAATPSPAGEGLKLKPVPQVFTVTVLPTSTPRPVYRPAEELPWYRLEREDVETLAKLLWSSPLRSESEKVKLIWCVLNRVADNTGRFGATVEECVNTTEFPWYDRKARISDRNRELVEREITRWMAYRDGYGIGWHPSTRGVFLRFVGEYNRKCELLADPYGRALE